MDKSNNSFLGILGCAILYAVTSFACAFLGFLSPWCWIVVFPVLAAVLGADYADGLRTLSSIWALLLVIALTLAVGFVGIRIAAAKMKSSDRFS
jgi:cytochrome c biogenesis protein CcdA